MGLLCSLIPDIFVRWFRLTFASSSFSVSHFARPTEQLSSEDFRYHKFKFSFSCRCQMLHFYNFRRPYCTVIKIAFVASVICKYSRSPDHMDIHISLEHESWSRFLSQSRAWSSNRIFVLHYFATTL